MALDVTARRRWFGAIVLLAALGMLICGVTVLEGRLGNLAFFAYWLVCFGFTGLAILIALVDARALRYRIRQQQRDLFEATLKEIEAEAKAKSRRPDRRRKKS
jgi:membrane protein implicated in regulation of membrane protease activity